MRTLSELTEDQRTEAHDTADTLTSEKLRSYLPGRLPPLLLSRSRDELAEALGKSPPVLPHRDGLVRAAKLDDLTSSELNELSESVVILVTRYADTTELWPLAIVERAYGGIAASARGIRGPRIRGACPRSRLPGRLGSLGSLAACAGIPGGDG